MPLSRLMRVRARATLLAVAALVVACKSNRVTGDLAITNVTLIDGTSQPPISGQTIVIAGDSIVSVNPSDEITLDVKRTVDGRGKWVIPGLWDNHVHLFGYDSRAFPLFLANGVTTIHDVGDPLSLMLALRDSTKTGALLGPTVLLAGPIIDGDYVVRAVRGTPMAAARVAVTDSASGVRVADSLAKAGVDYLKVHANTPRAGYNGVLAEAKKLGLNVVGHVPDVMTLDDALAAGQRTIEHDSELEMAETPSGAAIHEWMYAHMTPILEANKNRPTIGPIFGWRLRAADSAMTIFDSTSAAAFAERVAKLPVWFDPTLVVLEVVFRGAEPGVLDRSALKYAPAAAREFNDGGVPDKPPTAAELALGRKRWENALKTLTPLIRANAKIITGTDIPESPLVPGFSLHREMQNLVRAGMTPIQAIQAGSRNSADASGKLARVGTLERGKVADLIVLDADPTKDIKNTTRIRAVVTRGRLLDRAKLDSMLSDAEAYAKAH